MQTTFPVVEIFYSLQGEGSFQGSPAIFVRLAGCDVGCVWCDVKESWHLQHPNLSIEQILQTIQIYPSRIVVLTGGEPLMHDIQELARQIRIAGYRLHLETSGTYPLAAEFDWICVSPKKFKPMLDETLSCADELKVVVYNTSDFSWAEKQQAKVPAACLLYLQPEWSKEKEMMPGILDYLYRHPEWKLSVQLHKYLHIP